MTEVDQRPVYRLLTTRQTRSQEPDDWQPSDDRREGRRRWSYGEREATSTDPVHYITGQEPPSHKVSTGSRSYQRYLLSPSYGRNTDGRQRHFSSQCKTSVVLREELGDANGNLESERDVPGVQLAGKWK